MSTSEYRGRLIDEVKRFPVLYDTKHENHRDIDVRDRCWLQISERLGLNSEILKREWKILRDSLRQALKKSASGATTKAGAPCKRWRFQTRMAFLLPYMTARRYNNPWELKKHVKVDSDGEAEAPAEGGEAGEWEGHDSLELFFASVCQSAKRLPRAQQATLKRLVLEALLRQEDAAPGAKPDHEPL